MTEKAQSEDSNTEFSRSANSQNVHDFIYSEKYFGDKKRLPRDGKFKVLTGKEKTVQANQKRETMESSYDLEIPEVNKLIKFCQTTLKDKHPINPFPILHQLYRGRLVVKKQAWKAKYWAKIIFLVLEIQKLNHFPNLTFVYLDGCDSLDDATIA